MRVRGVVFSILTERACRCRGRHARSVSPSRVILDEHACPVTASMRSWARLADVWNAGLADSSVWRTSDARGLRRV